MIFVCVAVYLLSFVIQLNQANYFQYLWGFSKATMFPCHNLNIAGQRHYMCINDTVVCLQGWKNPSNLCRDPICTEGCVKYQGTCVGPDLCHCFEGYKGTKCEQCIPLPGCKHGTCTKGYECKCEKGYRGALCEEPICAEGCDALNGFCSKPGECKCKVGWKGKNCTTCETLIGCKHGFCKKGMDCICENGWTGITCERPVCSANCSETHGSCEEPNTCYCEKGYKGINCDECITYPGCRFGSCNEPWECNCLPGWKGMYCNIIA